MATERFNERVKDIAIRASKMRSLCIDSQYDAMGNFISDDNQRLASIDAAAAADPMFESVSDNHRIDIVSGMASAVAEYSNEFKCHPRDEVLASAHKAMESLIIHDSAGQSNTNESKMLLESIGVSMSTSDGIDLNAKMVGLILPVLLATTTSDAVTYIPAANDEIEIFKVDRVAGSNFGDMKKGQIIDDSTIAQYSQMKQRYPFVDGQQPDGTKKEFVFTSKTDLLNTKIDLPFKKGSVSLYFNRQRVAGDFEQKNGKIYGDITISENESISVNGTIDYSTGSASITTSTALPDKAQLHLEFEIDIESNPELIPTITNEMSSRKLRPSQAAIACDATIQAMFKMQRELGIDLKSMQMSQLRNYLANEKALKHLADMIFACQNGSTFNIFTPAGEDWKMHRELLREKLLLVSKEILKATKTTGLTGMFAGIQASTILKSMGSEFFTPAQGYRQTNRVHFTGMLFGIWRVYEVPMKIGDLNEWDILCYGRGSNHSEAGYVAADAIPATMYNHPIGASLRSRNTLWELSYGELQPFNGASYFYKLTIENTKPKAE